MADKRKRRLTPRQARTAKPRPSVRVGVVNTPAFWMWCAEKEVTLCAQRNGEYPTEHITLPRGVFDAFVRWYKTGRWQQPRGSRGPKPGA